MLDPSTLRSVKASEEGLKRVDRARKRMGWSKTRSKVWWLEANVSQATLRRFWKQPILLESFVSICKAVGIEDWEDLIDWSDLAAEEPPATESKPAEEPSLPAIVGEFPEGPVPVASDFYIDRLPIETRCYDAILRPGALIRIKSPRQMGKTSLLYRICDRAEKQGYQVVRLNLSKADKSVLSDLDRLLRWFCACISLELKLQIQPKEDWDSDRGSIVNCTTYVEAQILEQLQQPFVLALDEVDWLFDRQEVSQGFFSMLRSWHEEAKTIEAWEQLRLIVVHSTEDYGRLDLNQSPFNVGLPVELPEFTPQQVEDLLKRYRLDWHQNWVQRLMAVVGGHPYLVRLAIDELAWQKATLTQLLQKAPTDAGIYTDHLRRHLKKLQERPELAAAFHQVVNASEPLQLDTMQAYKLYSMGLVRRTGNRVSPRCRLYQEYFQSRL
ncbi:MAG: serine/threonine protein kinase [Cyanobacteria bacterium RM1_2_2]|nr:serine/threonine protein kinase [Cyanobacteria bacterium RM1_2_2]